jgi:transcription elongation factor GreB
MARWRPPRPRSSPYITPEGERKLKAELRQLWLQRRQDVVPALKAAAAEGDRSENAEYIYRKRQLAEIDRRVRYLSRRLDEVEVVHHQPHREERIHFGATVRLEDGHGELCQYRIVGADEIDAAKCWISVDSPMAKALLGRRAGDVVRIELPNGMAELEVLKIFYK